VSLSISTRQGFIKSEDVKKGGCRMRSPRAADGVGASDMAGPRMAVVVESSECVQHFE
jgi:hypothetical protein